MNKDMLGNSVRTVSHLKYFNLSLFVTTNVFLFIFAISRGLVGIINILSIFSISIIFLSLYLILSKKLNQTIFEAGFFTFTLFNYAIGFLGVLFIRDAIVMKYNIANISLSLIPFFLKQILGPVKLLIFFATFVLAIIIAMQLVKRRMLTNPKKISRKTIGMTIITCVMLFSSLSFGFDDEIYNPYTSALSYTDYNTKIALDDTQNITPQDFHKNNLKSYNLKDKKYKYSFVFVIEQTSLEDFYREKDLIKTENFFEKVKDKTHFFKNYYTSNQDSRTAVWEMLSSFFIPIESYIEPWQDYYGYILETNNLISHLKENNVEPYSVSSVGGGSLILGIYPFNEFIKMNDYENEKEGFVCSSEFSYQEACEDFAIFDKLKKHIAENKEKDLFYFQEMIFGHGEAYMEISGKNRVEYYNDYFNEFYSFLEDEEILNESIILILSDHGPKGGAQRKPSDFNIPLMVVAQDLEYREVKSYYSHLSFKDIFLSYYLGRILPAPEKLIYLIDQSGRQKRGYVDSIKNYSILGDMDNDFFFLEESLSGIKTEDVKNKIERLSSYEKYVNKLSTENHTYTYIP